MAELRRYGTKSDVSFTEEEPKTFRVVDGVYTEIMRRLHGETEYTNVEIKKTGKITIFFFLIKKRD